MAIKFSKIKPGMELFDIHRTRMGNTMMSRWGKWIVKIVEVQEDGAIVSWNHNPTQFWSRRRLEKLYAKEPPFFTKQE